MDSETERTRQLGCWDGPAVVSNFLPEWTSSESTPNFEPSDVYCNALIGVGFNECSDEVREFWQKTIKENYRGDEGRRRIRMAAINLAERGGLHLRLPDVLCPVLWLHVGLPMSILRLILSDTGHQGRSILSGKCSRRDQDVYRIPKCKVGASGRWCPFLELLPSRRSRACACAICQSAQVDVLSRMFLSIEITDGLGNVRNSRLHIPSHRASKFALAKSSITCCKSS